MEGQRVNHITVMVDKDNDGVVLTMYRTHTKLGQVNNVDLGIQPFGTSGAKSRTAYGEYCRETLINLLENGGIAGFYYDRGQVGNTQTSGKYDTKRLKQAAEDRVVSVIQSLGVDGIACVKVSNVDVDVKETYKDDNIKYATARATTTITSTDGRGMTITIPVDVKSGQLCKPRDMIDKFGAMKSINATNVKGLFKGDGNG